LNKFLQAGHLPPHQMFLFISDGSEGANAGGSGGSDGDGASGDGDGGDGAGGDGAGGDDSGKTMHTRGDIDAAKDGEDGADGDGGAGKTKLSDMKKAGDDAGDGDGKSKGIDGLKLDHIPKHFVGKTAQETIDKIHDAYKGLRDKGAEKAPENVDGYELTVSDDNKQFLDPASEDDKPVIDAFKQVALDAGLSASKFNEILNGAVKAFQEGGLIEAATDPDKEFEVFGDKLEGMKVLNTVEAWGKGLLESHVLSKDEHVEFENMAGTGLGLKVMNTLREAAGGAAVPVNLPVGVSGDAAKELQSRLNDPRMATDPAFAQETFKMAETAMGTGPA